VADHLDDPRLEDLYVIGIDDMSCAPRAMVVRAEMKGLRRWSSQRLAEARRQAEPGRGRGREQP
jgi:hypothetical protein